MHNFETCYSGLWDCLDSFVNVFEFHTCYKQKFMMCYSDSWDCRDNEDYGAEPQEEVKKLEPVADTIEDQAEKKGE